MVPNVKSLSTEETCARDTTLVSSKELRNDAAKPPLKYRREIMWSILIVHAYLNLAGLYGIYLMFTSAKVLTGLWAFILMEATVLATTAGAHRLWSHRSYKAKWPLRFILMLIQTMAFQDTIYEWARNHRVHHKYSDTDADPHNVRRGLFFSHYGWVLVRKHPAVKEEGKKLDFSDLEDDIFVSFQKRYYIIMMPVLCYLIPSAIPVYFWGESWTNAYHIAGAMRQVLVLHISLSTNSFTHWPSVWKKRPYERNMLPSENFMVSLLTLGEGWHNFHHVFPWDYKTAELGNNRINPTTHFLNFCARMGWAYDLKTVPDSVVKKRVERTGDGSHEVWGWCDRDMTEEDKNLLMVVDKK